MECAGTVTLFKKGYIRIQFWHCGGRVRSTLNTGTSPTERTADTSITWSRLLSFCWKARFLPWIAIKSLTPSPRTEKHLACRKASLSDLSHSMPHDCVIDFWERRLLDPVERERENYWAKSKPTSDGCNRCLSLRNLRNGRPCIGRKADYGARRISNDHSIEVHETP